MDRNAERLILVFYYEFGKNKKFLHGKFREGNPYIEEGIIHNKEENILFFLTQLKLQHFERLLPDRRKSIYSNNDTAMRFYITADENLSELNIVSEAAIRRKNKTINITDRQIFLINLRDFHLNRLRTDQNLQEVIKKIKNMTKIKELEVFFPHDKNPYYKVSGYLIRLDKMIKQID